MSGRPHRACCNIDLGALAANVERMRDIVADDCDIWPVVKARAYGHGADVVARTLQAAGVTRLCVVAASEVPPLRAAGVTVPLLMMGPPASWDLAPLTEAGVEITATDAAVVDSIIAAGDARGDASPVRVHLKVDTGMGRWGVRPDEAVQLAAELANARGVELVGMMTHFATADEPDDAFLRAQLAAFTPIVSAVRASVPGVLVHAANSAAALRFPETHFDAIRPGVATYGLDPMQQDATRHGLTPVLSLLSRVSSIRELSPGESTGYARRFVAEQPTRIALLPVGYADGVRRALSGTGAVAIGGRRYPIAGIVSMDHISVIVDEHVQPGQVATLIGQDGVVTVTAEEHAGWADTINYEITSGIADQPRLARTTTDDSH